MRLLQRHKYLNKMTITLTDNNFDELVLGSTVPVLVDFWADWCSPCKMLNPVIETLSAEYQDKVLIGKINVDSYPDVARRYDIRHIPALLLFKNGELVDRHTGPVPQHILSVRLEHQLT